MSAGWLVAIDTRKHPRALTTPHWLEPGGLFAGPYVLANTPDYGAPVHVLGADGAYHGSHLAGPNVRTNYVSCLVAAGHLSLNSRRRPQSTL